MILNYFMKVQNYSYLNNYIFNFNKALKKSFETDKIIKSVNIIKNIKKKK